MSDFRKRLVNPPEDPKFAAEWDACALKGEKPTFVSVGLNQPQIVKSNQPIPVDRNQPIAPDGVDAPAIELRHVTASLAVRRVVWSLGVGPRPRRYQAHARGSSALAS